MASIKIDQVNKPSGKPDNHNTLKGESSPPTNASPRRSKCQCQLIKVFRYENCDHTELQRGGPHPYCLLDGFCTEVGSVRKLLYLVGPGPHSNQDEVGECLECHAGRAYQAAHPDASRADLRNETRRALKQSRLPQEQRACEVLLATSEARTKPLGRAKRARIVARAEGRLRHLVFRAYRPVGGPLRHDRDILYRLAAEVCAICERLGPDADGLLATFGEAVTAYRPGWAGHLCHYVRAWDVRLGGVYSQAFMVQLTKNKALQEEKKKKNEQQQQALRTQQGDTGRQGGEEKEEVQQDPQEEVEDAPQCQDEQLDDPEMLELEQKPESEPETPASQTPMPETPHLEREPELEPEFPQLPEHFANPALGDSLEKIFGPQPVGSWADECEEIDW